MPLFGTGIVLVLILLVTNLNIEVSISNKKDGVVTGQQITKVTPQSQGGLADNHHGGGAPTDTTIFESLVGKPAPDFTLDSFDKRKIALSALKGKRVILFFNEGLMCYPACWNQIAALGKDTELQDKSVLLSITVDPKDEWQKAIAKMPELAQATVVFDSTREVARQYGVLTLPSSMHKGQFPGHSYVIIDKEGIVRFARDDTAMAVRNKELLLELGKIN